LHYCSGPSSPGIAAAIGKIKMTGTLLLYALSFLDVKTFLFRCQDLATKNERVKKTWRKLLKEKTFDGKCSQDGPKAFQSKEEIDRCQMGCFSRTGHVIFV
jgi:hypothetical protein